MIAARLATVLLLSATVCTSAIEPKSMNTPPPQDAEPRPVAEVAAPSSAGDVAWVDVDAMLLELPATLTRTNVADLESLAARIAAVPGVAKAAADAGASRIAVELATEHDAAHVAAMLGWTDVHVISGDVHQHNWHLVVRTEDLPDPHGRRIATKTPSFGGWALEIAATARPEGPLPGISAGASPGYPLGRYTAKVQRLSIRREG
jgi:hypothetical protein